MIVRLTNTASLTLDLPVQSVRWTLLSTRGFGEASFTIPYGSPALATDDYFDQDGGSLVEIIHPSLGKWQGICARPTMSRAGAQVQALHIAALTDRLPVARNQVFQGMTAGGIAYAAVQSATVGLGRAVFRAGTFVEAAPVIDTYTFTGQSLSSVLGDLAERTGQDWLISDDGAISWVPRRGSLYDRWLCDSGDLADVARTADVTERVVGLIVRDADGREQNLTLEDRAAQNYWQRRDVLNVGTTSSAVAGMQGIQQLTQRRGAAVRFQIKLKRRAGG